VKSSVVSRRAILRLSLTLSGLMSLAGLFRFLSYQPTPAAPVRFTLGPLGDYPPGSVTPIPQAKAWLIQDEAGLYAVSAICTHLGCTVNRSDAAFECPCHDSRYDLAGNVLRGPARLALSHLEVTLSPEGLVVLDTSAVVPPSQRLAPSS
jgi:cytochrome b6-f complex iron-sulfur subunit